MSKSMLKKIINRVLKSTATSGYYIEDDVLAIIEAIKNCVPESKQEGKHDGCENDARSWCYSCNESAEESEFTNVRSWNKCRDEMLNRLGI